MLQNPEMYFEPSVGFEEFDNVFDLTELCVFRPWGTQWRTPGSQNWGQKSVSGELEKSTAAKK